MIWLWLTAAFALDLDTARERATAQALGVERAQAAAVEARGDTIAAIEAAMPAIEAFANASTGAGQTAFGFPRPIAAQFGLGARLGWTALDPAAWATATGARQVATAARATEAWARVDARASATAGYASAWATQQERAVLAQLAEDAERLAAVVSERVSAGLAPTVDAQRLTAEVATATARHADADARSVRSCAALQSLIGDPIDGECELEPPIWPTPGEGPRLHPALDALGALLDAAASGHRASAWALGPVLSVDGSVAHYIVPGTGSGPGWSLGAEASIPLLNAGGSWGGLTAARARVRDAEAAVEEQRRALAAVQIAAARRHAAATTALGARTMAVEASNAARLASEELYLAGVHDLTDLLAARATWAEARVAEAAAHAERGAALAELESARGVH